MTLQWMPIPLAIGLLLAPGDDCDPGGGEPTPDPGFTVTECSGVPYSPPATGLCEVEDGNSSLLFRGDVSLPGNLVRRGAVLVVDDTIVCSGCDCEDSAEAQGATVVTCAEGLITAGLINAHEHITFTERPPEDNGDYRYDHRNEWRKGIGDAPKITAYQNSHSQGDAWGEMRHLMGGATSMFGSGGEGGMTRNLDRTGSLQEDLNHQAAEYETFPLSDSGFNHLVEEGCSEFNIDGGDLNSYAAFVPHVAEGVGVEARNEFLCLSGQQSGGEDWVMDGSSFIHSVGLVATDVGLMATESTGMVWSPRSNTSLYGMTADVPTHDAFGVQIALGTDWLASGSMNMVRELMCAREWNETYWDSHFSDADLVAMATHGAAEALGFSDALGSLTRGRAADLTIWNASVNADFEAVLNASPADVALVVRGGEPLYGDAALMTALGQTSGCEVLGDVCGTAKRLCAERELGVDVESLRDDIVQSISGQNPAGMSDSVKDSYLYPLFYCGEPVQEPSCLPARPGEFDGLPTGLDFDGDAIPNEDDNCPERFNPIRPLDGGNQADADGDGQGDVCDPCPLDSDDEDCGPVDGDDLDGDGVQNAFDNCPSDANPAQQDSDDDGKGDACDACPDEANPGSQGCPTLVYDIKDGSIAVGESVTVQQLIVTAAESSAFYATVNPNSADYEGPAFSSIYVYNQGETQPSPGTVVTVTGAVNSYFGQIQLTANDITINGTGAAVPPAEQVNPNTVATGGAFDEAYEALLVVVEDVTVTNANPSGASGENVSGEFNVTGGLPVDDAMYLVSPFPSNGDSFTSITGVLRYTWERNKLMPRSASDVVR